MHIFFPFNSRSIILDFVTNNNATCNISTPKKIVLPSRKNPLYSTLKLNCANDLGIKCLPYNKVASNHEHEWYEGQRYDQSVAGEELEEL